MEIRMIQCKQKVRIVLLCFTVVFFGTGILIQPEAVSGGVSSGLFLCLHTLIPATFPFVVLSALCVHSGASRRLGMLFAPLTRLLFRLPGCCGIVILLSWLGGYPAGVRGIVSLFSQKEISKEQAQRMLWFCVSAGPSFTVSVIGAGMCGNPSFGIMLFLSQTIALFCMGIVSGIGKSTARPEIRIKPEEASRFSTALVLSAEDGAKSTMHLCCFVTLFTAAMEVWNRFGFLQIFSRIFRFFRCPTAVSDSVFPLLWEITSGTRFACSAGIPPTVLCFFTAMGGVCVWMQIFAAAVPLRISIWRFVLSRLCHGGLSALFFCLIRPLFPMAISSEQVFSNTTEMLEKSISLSGETPVFSILCGSALLALCVVFLICSKGDPLEKFR